MSLTVRFGKTEDPVNCPNKTYTLIESIEGNPIEPENMETPTFLIDYSDSLLECNYCEIVDWNRFYFCKVTHENGGNSRVNCYTDPLKTFWDGYIKKQSVTIVRSSSFGKPTYVPDERLPIDASRVNNPKIIYFDTVHRITNGDNAACYEIMNTL